MERRNIADDGTPKAAQDATRILSIKTYVRRVTAAPNKRRGRHCQGLHNAAFLPYGSSQMERSAHHFAANRLAKAFNFLPPRREDECIGC
jgi:hypothetical protein